MDSAIDRLLPPRVSGEFGPMPLIDVLKDLLATQLAKHRPGVVVLHGTGCTSALRFVQHLADEEDLSITTQDGLWSPVEMQKAGMLQVATNYDGQAVKSLRLCDWGRDEFIDYLLRYHPSQCKRVMQMLASVNSRFAGGSPFVWQPYLEWLATHDELIQPDQFIAREIEAELNDRSTLTTLVDGLLSLNNGDVLKDIDSHRVRRWLRLDDVKHTLMAQRLAEHIYARNRGMLKHRWPSELLKATARILLTLCADFDGDLQRVIEYLQRSSDKNRYSSTAISLLNSMVPNWKPDLKRSVDLSWADFHRAKWSGCGLREANLRSTDLSEADLTSADIRSATLHHARFCGAALNDVRMSCVKGREVSFSGANLSRADLNHSQFTQADFSQACLKESNFSYCGFDRANMRGVDWRGGICNNCRFYMVNFEEAQLSGALIRNSYFSHVNFKGASLQRGNFGEAHFAAGTDLEQLDLSGCNFAGAKLQGCYLTDSTASHASFKLADLSRVGLAGVVWENCDLRGADLRGAAFHMGSTRCGLVDSPYPSHGTRTGFYTDDYVDLSFKHPEQVRKAALIGCDLRGAILFGCDFYLVDVRDCQLDPEQRELMASCGAILE